MKKTPGFISVGAAAILAGCGGGAAGGALPGRAISPANPNTGARATATLKLQIPARGTAAARRKPKWISPGSVTLGVRVLASPVPNPTPTEAVFTIPTPGPVPTSMSVQVQAPLSDDTFVASVYDGNHNLLATGSSAPTDVTAGSTPTVSVSMLGVASGVQYTVAGSTPAVWRVLENVAAPQTTTVDAQPVDADGNLIPGTLASPAPLDGTDGVTLSPSSITAAGDVTATYPSTTSGSASLTSSLALNAGTSTLNATVDGDYYVFALNSDGSVQVVDGLLQTQVGSALTGLTGGDQIAALSGCATGAFAVADNGSTGVVYAVGLPTTADPTPPPAATALSPSIVGANPFWYGVAADTQCNAFYNVNTSGYPVTKLHGFDTTIAASASFATGFSYNYALKSIDGELYSASNPAAEEFGALAVSESTGGAANAASTYTAPYLVANALVGGSGTSVYVVSNLCSGQPVLQSLSGGSLITLSSFEGVNGTAEAADGTIYLVGSAESGSAQILSYGALGSIATAPSVSITASSAIDVAVTPDQQYVCVLEAPTGTSGQVQFFKRLPSPSLVATVPLSATVEPTAFSIGP